MKDFRVLYINKKPVGEKPYLRVLQLLKTLGKRKFYYMTSSWISSLESDPSTPHSFSDQHLPSTDTRNESRSPCTLICFRKRASQHVWIRRQSRNASVRILGRAIPTGIRLISELRVVRTKFLRFDIFEKGMEILARTTLPSFSFM